MKSAGWQIVTHQGVKSKKGIYVRMYLARDLLQVIYNLLGYMFTHCIRYIFLAVLSIQSISCIFDGDSDCPVRGYAAEVSVKDINYDNIKNFPHVEVKDKDMPFHNFAGTVYYVLSDMSGKHVSESAVLPVSGDGRTYTIPFGDVPEGEYVLSVWGNLTGGYPAGALHPDGQEYTDIYVGSCTVCLDCAHRTTELALERTKGLLLLSCSGFPDDVSWIKMSVSGVCRSVDADFNYAGSVNVEKVMPFQPFTTTLLSPSASGASVLRLSFHTGNPATSEPFLELPDIDLSVCRNEISSVAIDYHDEAGMYEVRMFINEHWVMIHRLYIK